MLRQVSLQQNGAVSVLTKIDGTNHRRAYVPGDDLSGLPSDVREAIEAHWTEDVRAAWEERRAAEREEHAVEGARDQDRSSLAERVEALEAELAALKAQRT